MEWTDEEKKLARDLVRKSEELSEREAMHWYNLGFTACIVRVSFVLACICLILVIVAFVLMVIL
jgi:hypothetical protein